MFYEKIADNEGYLNITRRRGNRNTRGDLMPHFHNSIEFYLCVKGEYLVYINGERHLLHAGEIAFVDRFTIHDACFIGAEEETEVYFIIASSAYLTGLQWLADETLPPFTGRKEGFERIISFVSMAYSMRDEMDEDMMRGFVTLLLGMMRNHCGSLPRVTEKGTQVLIDVMKHIDENLSERITLDSLSRIYGYEKTYFSRVFNRILGMNLREYVNRRRVTQAARLRRDNPELPIYKVARLCGFDSLNTYYRAMKAYGQKHNF